MRKQHWKKYVRYCVQCRKVGPRCFHPKRGLMHKYCMNTRELKEYTAALIASYTKKEGK